MKNTNFNNGLSITQLEERFEMVAAAEGTRTRTTTIDTTIKTQ